MRPWSGIVGLVAGCVLSAAAGGAASLMDWPDLVARPKPAPTERIPYSPGPLQFVELWKPDGQGPFPVVVMIHGGCWRSGVAKLDIMNYAAEDLRRRGFAVWNLEYRGVDRPGGGYPGTFQDVAAGADMLARLGPGKGLDVHHVVALGHSAGGHLALWLAARPRLPARSPLRAAHPLRIAGVVSLGGLPDLAAERARGDESCGADTIGKLTGAPAPGRTDVYADTSPVRLGAGREPQVLINGEADPLATSAGAQAYAARMRGEGAQVRTLSLADTGHVELIAPGTPAWAKAVETVEQLLGRR